MISDEVINSLSKAKFHLMEHDKIKEIPDELKTEIITRDGVFINIISTDKDELIQEELFGAFGKLVTLSQFIKDHNLNHKYSVALVLTSQQFRSIHKKLRQVINEKIPILILT